MDKENPGSLNVPAVRDIAVIRGIPVQVLFLLAAFVVLYFPTFQALLKMWWSSDDYSHGFFVPFISLYLVWVKREQLRDIRSNPNLKIGVLLILSAGFLLNFGRAGEIAVLQELSMLVMIAGLIALLLGVACLRMLALPIAYLLFMIKIFGEGVDWFHWPFQLVAADIGVWLLRLFGFAAYQEANYIQLPRVTLEVAAACSGVRFLVSIIAIGIPLAHVTQRTWFRKIGLVLFAVIVAIIANGIRVALIGVWAYHNGDADIHGPFHVLYGVFVSWVGFIVLFVGAWILSKGPRGDKYPVISGKSLKGAKSDLRYQWHKWLEAAQSGKFRMPLFVAIVLLMAIGGYYYLHRTVPIPLKDGFMTFPMIIGEWKGEDVDPGMYTLRLDWADEELMRIYRDKIGNTVKLYIAYFDDQQQGKELIMYKTSWIFHRGDGTVGITGVDGKKYKVNQVVLNEGNSPQAVLFWYSLNGRVVANRYIAKLYTIWDALVYGRTNGALVSISAPLGQQEQPENGFENERRFIRDAMLAVHNYLPGK